MASISSKNLHHDKLYKINCHEILTKTVIAPGSYDHDLIEIAKNVKREFHKKYFLISFGDSTDIYPDINFTKAKKVGDENKICLYLDAGRHFSNHDIAIAREDPSSFKKKVPKVIWRGVTTNSKARFELCKKWENHIGHIDVGFTEYVQNVPHIYKLKPKLSIKDMMKCKYLLVLEGNDVATGFCWSFLSNSLVMMPKPKYETIIGHHKLIPDYHYIEIKEDTSDLQDKFIWCENNQIQCEKIIKNKKEFINNVINHNLYKESVRILEQNFIPYIDRADLTQIIFKKIQFDKYLDDDSYDYHCSPTATFNYYNKNSNLSFDKGIITIRTDKIFDENTFNQLSKTIVYDKTTGIKINTNDIVYIKETDHIKSIKNMAKLCFDLNIKPLKMFIINNVFYIYDYDVVPIELNEIQSILQIEYDAYSSNSYCKMHNECL